MLQSTLCVSWFNQLYLRDGQLKKHLFLQREQPASGILVTIVVFYVEEEDKGGKMGLETNKQTKKINKKFEYALIKKLSAAHVPSELPGLLDPFMEMMGFRTTVIFPALPFRKCRMAHC